MRGHEPQLHVVAHFFDSLRITSHVWAPEEGMPAALRQPIRLIRIWHRQVEIRNFSGKLPATCTVELEHLASSKEHKAVATIYFVSRLRFGPFFRVAGCLDGGMERPPARARRRGKIRQVSVGGNHHESLKMNDKLCRRGQSSRFNT